MCVHRSVVLRAYGRLDYQHSAGGDARVISRARNCRVNQGNPLQRLSELVDDVFDGDKLRVSTPPKLAIVCAETVKPGLLAPPKPPHQDSWSDARFAVERFMTGMVRSLDLLGTVAFAVPRPWFAHGQRIRGTMSFPSCWSPSYTIVLRVCLYACQVGMSSILCLDACSRVTSH